MASTARLTPLSDVPEESTASFGSRSASPITRSPYIHHAGSPSSSTISSSASLTTTTGASATTPTTRQPSGPRKPSGLRDRPPSTRATSTNGDSSSPSSSTRRATGSPSNANTAQGGAPPLQQRIRTNPHMPHAKDVEIAPATVMYWSRAPVHGALPMRSMRAHSVTLVDNVAWLFGGCDDKGCWKDVYCFDIDTMYWTHPDTYGHIPPPCRAHTATLVDRRLVVFGGGQGPVYYDTTYVLDTVTRTWTQIHLPRNTGSNAFVHPSPRRAHTAVLYKGKIWIFGGGNGMTALNDTWTLDVSGVGRARGRDDVGKEADGTAMGMRWEMIETRGRKPLPRGYHTANLVGNIMVVVGGSDGKECFGDVWCLNLDTRQWSQITPAITHRRLSHTATQVGSYLFVMGGHDGSTYTNELLLFNLGVSSLPLPLFLPHLRLPFSSFARRFNDATHTAVSLEYEPRPVLGRLPSPRGYHVALLADNRLFVFGGFNGHDVYDDVHVLDLAAAAYLPQVTSFVIDI
ncbi:hypothetical protein PLICRDRAFT_179731 [Plicaturopsis crispa FD-325 SS-3]|uniref:Unplaced genomic scaffold PLICRscaffold_19, whole genome shotgun sequence n=1 Tax=Plicaturopsis crispa FD-325 SS-3 TaxID=944288 RepID=A0A0C9SQT4_PLICR|nr:hypothetical protein PLICRDRAFT_179731 [Plicaturopsis crispa FD-325 SS-3]